MKKYTELQIEDGVFEGLHLIEPDCYQDFRGYYWTLYNQKDIPMKFNHDKVTVSKKNVLRGIHGDQKAIKFISCVYGEVYYVAVDTRESSETFGEWRWTILSHTNRKIVVVPPGIGSSYLILSDNASVLYKWSYDGEYPDVEDQFTIPWNDKKLNISWPISNPILQERDAK